MNTEEIIEILMKKYNLKWEQAAMILIAINRMKEEKNNGNQSKM